MFWRNLKKFVHNHIVIKTYLSGQCLGSGQYTWKYKDPLGYTKCTWLTLAWEISFYYNVAVHIKKTQKEVTIKSLPRTYQNKRELIILNTMFLSHGNQSDNFQNKSIDLFLYYGNFDHKWPSQLCFNFMDPA